MLKRIGAEERGELKAIASGTLPCGRPVVINSDGTVGSISLSSASENLGNQANVINSASGETNVVYDSNANKFLVVYRASNNYGKCKVGTIDLSDPNAASVTFGSEVTFNAGNTTNIAVAFDSTNNKVVISYRDLSNSNYGTAIVGTISGTSITFGSEQVYANVNTSAQQNGIAYDSSNQRIVIAYRDNTNSRGSAVVGTVSGTSISFGSPVNFRNGVTNSPSISFNSGQNKVLICYGDANASASGIVGTVSGTSISFGSATTFLSSESSYIDLTYSSSSDKHILVYKDVNDSNNGKVRTATISGTDVSFGTAVDFETEIANYNSVTFDETAKKFVIHYTDGSGGGNADKVYYVTGSISGTDVTVNSRVSVDTTANSGYTAVAANGSGQALLFYQDGSGGNLRANALQIGYSNTNLTSENYIGMSRGVAEQTGDAAVIGSPVVYENATSNRTQAVYDANAQKVVIAYKDSGNSGSGTAIVGTVSGSSITFGTAVAWESGVDDIRMTYDSYAQKIVIAYVDSDQPLPCKAIVGTVSGTSISFGSAVTFDSQYSIIYGIAYDSNAQRVVIGYRRQQSTDATYGSVIVGTVSGTSISFGSRVVLNPANTTHIKPVYDANSQKVVIAYTNNGSGGAGTAKVGTVSGTSISFGSAVEFESGDTGQTDIVYDPDSQKIVIGYQDGGNSNYGTAVVGTVSGTSISFGSASVFEQASVEYVSATYDTAANKVVFMYKDQGNSNYLTAVVGTVSGTSISFDTPTLIHNASASYIASAYDSNANKHVVGFPNGGNSSHGTAIVFSPSTIATTRAEVASGQPARVDIIGSVSNNQIGLTAGQQYFVQTDGTISETAGSPSVFAGTAISATELVVKS